MSSNFYGLQDQSISSWGGTHYDVRLYAAKVVSILAKNYRFIKKEYLIIYNTIYF